MDEPMPFAEAAAFRMPWGKYKGEQLDEIAVSDQGLRYLDWLRGKVDAEESHTLLARAVRAYCEDQTIARDIAKVVRGG
jgi:hypothetical protein